MEDSAAGRSSWKIRWFEIQGYGFVRFKVVDFEIIGYGLREVGPGQGTIFKEERDQRVRSLGAGVFVYFVKEVDFGRGRFVYRIGGRPVHCARNFEALSEGLLDRRVQGAVRRRLEGAASGLVSSLRGGPAVGWFSWKTDCQRGADVEGGTPTKEPGRC